MLSAVEQMANKSERILYHAFIDDVISGQITLDELLD
jgi:hypothetical protein